MRAKSVDNPWVLVAGDFKESGGMDKANLMLARYLVDRGTPVHLVTHHADPDFASHPHVTVHHVPRPLRSYFLGSFLLNSTGRQVWQRLRSEWPAAVIVANGGNCIAEGAINWVHFVHHAWQPDLSRASWRYRLRSRIERGVELFREKRAFEKARIIITNSDMTSRQVRACLSDGYERVQRIYLGVDARWEAVTEDERMVQRQAFGIDNSQRIALFVGGLACDGRKGLDVLLRAWQLLCKDTTWDTGLLIAGTGPAAPDFERFADENGLGKRVRFLGFRKDIFDLLSCADVLVSTPRYEPYGLNVQEALIRGVAAITSSTAGVAERFQGELAKLLCHNPEDPQQLAEKLQLWRSHPEHWRELCRQLGSRLRHRTWSVTAHEMVDLIEQSAATEDLAVVAAH
jgi:glycosyltransferase involved in cell wall biosynthesis